MRFSALIAAFALATASAAAQPALSFGESSPTAPALVAPPHLDRSAYLSARGQREGAAVRMTWRIERESFDGEPIGGARERIVTVGPGFVLDSGQDEPILYDFALNRRLTLDDAASTFRNESFFGDLRRRLDTYLALSQGGTLDDIPFPGGLHFDRFWLESAMGLRREEAGLTITRADGVLRANRGDLMVFETALSGMADDETAMDEPAASEAEAGDEHDGDDTEPALPLRGDPLTDEAVNGDATAEPDSAVTAFVEAGLYGEAEADLFRRWMRHALPIHPDALASFNGPAIPEQFSFAVVSPESPDGRREIWTLAAMEGADADFPLPDGYTPAIDGPDRLRTQVVPAALAALAAPEAAPDQDDFVAAIAALREDGDLAGAYLAAFQETAHNGACQRGATDRRACAESQRVTAAGLGNSTFETLFAAIGAVGTGDHARAIDGLLPYLDRGGFVGAAANTIAANELIAAGPEIADAYPDLDPRDMLVAAQMADPYAPSIYWHLGRMWLASNNAPAAWAVFDLGRGLPAGATNAHLVQAAAQEGRLLTLSPAFFAPPEPPR